MNINESQKLLARLMMLDSDMSVSRASVFLDIASHGQTTPTEVATRLNMTGATASRHIAFWSHRDRHRQEGKGLVEYLEDPMDRRLRYVRLTAQGKNTIKVLFEEN